MTQVKNFLVVSLIWALGMLALTATRALIESAPTPAPVDNTPPSQQM